MSRQWQLALADATVAQATAWLAARPGAVPRGAIVELAGGVATASIAELKPYQREACQRTWGVRAAVELEFAAAVDRRAAAGQSAIYAAAFDALRRFPADAAFACLDVGIFVRRGGRMIVNPEAFQLAAFNALLEPPFWLADAPTHLLHRADAPEK